MDRVLPETKNWVSDGTVDSEGWFLLALYNLSNLFLMLTVQYFVSHFRKTLCKKEEKKGVFCLSVI